MTRTVDQNDGEPFTPDIDEDDDVPAEFLCPISLQLMRDPVTLLTGITYDRPSIVKWLASGHRFCPVTGQLVLLAGCGIHGASHDAVILQDPVDSVMVPNHTLHRLIHRWAQAHGHHVSPDLIIPSSSASNGLNVDDRNPNVPSNPSGLHRRNQNAPSVSVGNPNSDQNNASVSDRNPNSNRTNPPASDRDRNSDWHNPDHQVDNPISMSDQSPSSVDRASNRLAARLQVSIGRVVRGISSDRRTLVRLQRLHSIVHFAYLHRQSLHASSSSHAAATVASLLPTYGPAVIALHHQSACRKGTRADSAMAKHTQNNAATEICVEAIGVLTHLPHLGGETVSLLCGAPCPECIMTILSSSVLPGTARFHALKLLHRLFFHSNQAQAKLLRHIQIDNLIRALLGYTASAGREHTAGAGRKHSLHMLLVLSKVSIGLHEYTEALIFKTLMDGHAMAIILELLMTESEIEAELCERALALLNVLVCRREGLAVAIAQHVNMVPILARGIMTVSSEATGAAINSLIQLIRGASTPNMRAALVRDALKAGIIHRLSVLLQSTSQSLISVRDQAEELFLLLDEHSSPAGRRHDQHNSTSSKLGLIFHKQLTAMSNFLLH